MRGLPIVRDVGVVVAAVVLALVVIAIPPAWADHPELTSYDALQAAATSWEQAGARVVRDTTSTQGREILEVAVGTGPFTLISTNELHANEPSGTEQFVRLIWALLGDLDPTFEGDVWPGIAARPPIYEALADDDIRAELLSRVTIVGFAMLDPDGAETAHTRDPQTNLDYTQRLTPTTDALLSAFARHQPDLLLDAHGGPPTIMNIGLVEPIGVEPAVIAFSRAAAATAWRATSAVDATPEFFEEQPISLFLGVDEDPAASIDEAYYGALVRGLPLTVESVQLEGLPAVYTETIGLQSMEPEATIIAGASLQENITAALLFEGSGLLTGERPQKIVEESITGSAESTVSLPAGATRLFSTVHWEWFDPAQEWTLQLLDAAGEVVAEADADTVSPYRRSRAIATGGLPAGEYTVRAVQQDGFPLSPSTLRTLWYVEDPTVVPLTGILDGTADVQLCLPNESVYRDLVTSLPQTSGLGAPSCSDGGVAGSAPAPGSSPDPARAPATTAPAPAATNSAVAPVPVAPAAPSVGVAPAGSGGLPATGGGLAVVALTLALGASTKARRTRGPRLRDQ